MAKGYGGGPEYSWWQALLARLGESVPSWVWVASALLIPVAAVLVADPFGWRGAGTGPADVDPAPITVTVAPTPTRFAEAQATSDAVSLLRAGSSTPESLLAPQRTEIVIGDGIAVDEAGQAILRFSDFLTVQVLREGQLQVQQVDVSARSALALLGESGGAFLNELASAEERLAHRVEVESEYARIIATGTRFLVVKERNTPLEWVVALEAGPDDLRVTAAGVEKVAPDGIAYWITLGSAPSIPIRHRNAEAWLETVYAGDVRLELGDVIWPHADVITDTRAIGTFTETVASSGRYPPQVVLEDVILEFRTGGPDRPYELRDCNNDGILDVYMERGQIWFDFRGMTYRVRALDVQVLPISRADPFLVGYNPEEMALVLTPEFIDNDQLISLRSDMRLQASESEHQPFHFAEFQIFESCFLGFSLTPPNRDDSPGPPRWPVPLTPPDTATPTATPTVTVSASPTGTVSPTPTGRDGTRIATDTPTSTPTGSPTVTLTPTPTSSGTVTVTPTVTPTLTPLPTRCVRSRPSGWVAYVVTPGENLETIAFSRGTTPEQIAQVNCLPSIDRIRVRQELWVPPLAPTRQACSEQADINLSVRKISDERAVISWESNCFVSGAAFRSDGQLMIPVSLLIGSNGSREISLGHSCRAGESFILFELWFAAGQTRTVSIQVEC